MGVDGWSLREGAQGCDQAINEAGVPAIRSPTARTGRPVSGTQGCRL